jgi:hypothetical protein
MVEGVESGADIRRERRELVKKASALFPAGPPTPIRPGAQAGPDLRELRIIRQSVLKTAGEFCASRPDLKSAGLIALAERLEAWVLRPYAGPELADAF